MRHHKRGQTFLSIKLNWHCWKFLKQWEVLALLVICQRAVSVSAKTNILTSFCFPAMWFYQSLLVWALSTEGLLFMLLVLRRTCEGNGIKYEHASTDLQEAEITVSGLLAYLSFKIKPTNKKPQITLFLSPFGICHF